MKKIKIKHTLTRSKLVIKIPQWRFKSYAYNIINSISGYIDGNPIPLVTRVDCDWIRCRIIIWCDHYQTSQVTDTIQDYVCWSNELPTQYVTVYRPCLVYRVIYDWIHREDF